MIVDSFSPSSLQERVTAIAILLLALLAAGGIAYKLLAQPQLQLNARLEQLLVSYGKASRLESRKEGLEQQLRNWQETLVNNDSLLLPQNSFNLAAAALQERINSIVSLHGSPENPCRIQQQKNIPSVDDGPFTKVTVNVSLKCQLEPLQAVFYDLEAEKPVLILNDLIIKNNKQLLDLTASVDISGYIAKDTTSSLGATQ